MEKTVCVLATGGTISGSGAPGQSAVYRSGALDVKDLLQGLPELPVAVRGEQLFGVASDDLTAENWITLARRIHQLAADPDVCGFVITHGTNTMEETAFFLHLTLKTEKPVVLTGSMRPATAVSPDGPMNLWQAICLAASPEAAGLGVLVCFSDAVYGARDVQKISASRPQAFGGREYGCLGLMRDGRVFLQHRPDRPHTTQTPFSAGHLTELPRVDTVWFHAGAAPDLIDHSASLARGIVLAGAGAGHCSSLWETRLKACTKAGIPVVRGSRTMGGAVVWDTVDDECGTLPGYTLPPQKLRILLALCLAEGMDRGEIHRALQTY